MVRKPRAETKVRFSIRSLLKCTTAVAVLSAAAAPWFRNWSGEQQTAFLAAWASVALGAGVTIGIACLRRLRIERKAGYRQFEVPYSMTRWSDASAFAGAMLWSMFAVPYIFLNAFGAATELSAKRPLFNLAAFEHGVFFALAALVLWWRTNTVEFRERGMVTAFTLVPWSAMLGYHWGKVDGGILVLKRRRGAVRLRADLVDKAAIDGFLASRINETDAD